MLGGERAHMTNTSAAQGLSVHKKSQNTLFFSVQKYIWTSYYKIQMFLPNLLLQLMK